MVLSLSIFVLSIFLISLHNTPAKSDSADGSDFIRAECQATLYPALCIQCLSSYSSSIQQDELQLVEAALSVSLSRAQSLSDFVSKLSKMDGLKPIESQALKDCSDNTGDSVDRLSRSVKEFDRMNQTIAGDDFEWHISNVKTWVSAAMTSQNTCLDGFSRPELDGNVKFAIQGRVVDCSQVTSNALALVNRFAESHNQP